jgi:hypothetical protein
MADGGRDPDLQGGFAGRVDLAGRPPKSPTDPGVRSDRTRFVVSGLRCAAHGAVDHARRWEALTLLQAEELRPGNRSGPSAS